MKAIKATGLVPVKVLTRFDDHKPGKVFGLTPAHARKALGEEKVELFPIAEGIETIDVGEFTPAPAKKEAKAVTTVAVPFDIDIPAEWESRHYLQRIKLAKDVAGPAYAVPDGMKAIEYADEVIRAELERRSAA